MGNIRKTIFFSMKIWINHWEPNRISIFNYHVLVSGFTGFYVEHIPSIFRTYKYSAIILCSILYIENFKWISRDIIHFNSKNKDISVLIHISIVKNLIIVVKFKSLKFSFIFASYFH